MHNFPLPPLIAWQAKRREHWVKMINMHDRGRDAHYWAPPAQNRTGPIKASGSHLGCWRRSVRLAARVPGRGTRLAGSVSGARRPVPRSPRPPPLAPRTPRPVARPRSLASQLLWRSLTPRPRASSASARRLPDADRSPHARPRSRSPGFRSRSLRTCQGLRPRRTGNALALTRAPVSPSAHDNGVGVPIDSFAAQWLAYTRPCRRFAPGLTTDDARLGASAVRYAFTVVDLHHLLLAGLPGALSP